MQDLERALADISEIRGQLARGAAFHGLGAATLAATGGFAVMAGAAQVRWLPDPSRNVLAYVGLWTATAAVSVIIIGFETVTRSRRIHSGLAQEMILSAVEQFLPAALAGVLLTAVLLRFMPENLWMLPGLWQIVFSLGLFASCRFLPRPMLLAGGWYMATGLACLVLARGAEAFTPWAMGGAFGVGQLLIAGVLQHSTGGRDGQA